MAVPMDEDGPNSQLNGRSYLQNFILESLLMPHEADQSIYQVKGWIQIYCFLIIYYV